VIGDYRKPAVASARAAGSSAELGARHDVSRALLAADGRSRSLLILGCRGVPAAHGGFESFAEYLALFLVRRGWDVEIACQEEGGGDVWTDVWQGIRRIHFPVSGTGPASTIAFDVKSTMYAARRRCLVLLLGYNTAILAGLLRLRGVPVIINMDGLEWRRSKWPAPIKAWFLLMERLGCYFGSHLVADHPAIADHLATRVSRRKVTCIAYCADSVAGAGTEWLDRFNLSPGGYALVVARPEPENSILEIVTAQRRSRFPLIVLGTYRDTNPYHRAVLAAAGPQVKFVGAIYERAVVEALRFHARFYVHGHQVGGTNPSLVEALAAGSAVVAHDNPFNRWVAGPRMAYFSNIEECSAHFARLAVDDGLVATMRSEARARHAEGFTQRAILPAYEALLHSWLPAAASKLLGPATAVDRRVS
jgi:glycosyltransferase involved in cell wall biosynthesis